MPEGDEGMCIDSLFQNTRPNIQNPDSTFQVPIMCLHLKENPWIHRYMLYIGSFIWTEECPVIRTYYSSAQFVPIPYITCSNRRMAHPMCASTVMGLQFLQLRITWCSAPSLLKRGGCFARKFW
jgi:hypothetical protein